MKRVVVVFSGLALGIALTLTLADARGCAVAPPNNKSVEIADESAIIVWDSATGTEHFVRRATFKSAAQDFGFLVPTPTKPELAEADDAAFKELARITAPKVVTQPRPSSGGCSIGCSSAAKRDFAAAPGNVQVLDEQRVAGYDAVVLEADDADALAKWLREHGYEFSDALKSWAEHYIKAKWKITAFKVAKQAAENAIVSSAAVRMSFKTDKPFFPYREPVAAPGEKSSPRLLRVYFISSERVEGLLDGKPWPGKAVWSKLLFSPDHQKVAGQLKLPEKSQPSGWWLTEFEDRSSPRPGSADVFFSRSADQGQVERDPHIQYTSSNIPGDLMMLATCGLVAGVWLRRRRRG